MFEGQNYEELNENSLTALNLSRIDEYSKFHDFASIPVKKEHEYTIHDDKTIGEGGFSVVRSAYHLSSRKMVAVKIIDLDSTPSSNVNALNEINILKRLSHPYIINYHTAYKTPTQLHIIFEYVKGGDVLDSVVLKVTTLLQIKKLDNLL